MSLLPAQTVVVIRGPTGPTGLTGAPGVTGTSTARTSPCPTDSFLLDPATCAAFTGAEIPAITRSIFIPYTAFVTLFDGANNASWENGEGSLTRTSASMSTTIMAPVRLPRGAIPAGFTCFAFDNTADTLDVQLFSQTAPGAQSNCGPAVSTGQLGTLQSVSGGEACVAPANEDLTSPSFRVYSLRAKTSSTDASLRLFGCNMRFTITSLGN